MANISGFDLETFLIIYKWFLIFHESAFKEMSSNFLKKLFEEIVWRNKLGIIHLVRS